MWVGFCAAASVTHNVAVSGHACTHVSYKDAIRGQIFESFTRAQRLSYFTSAAPSLTIRFH